MRLSSPGEEGVQPPQGGYLVYSAIHTTDHSLATLSSYLVPATPWQRASKTQC